MTPPNLAKRIQEFLAKAEKATPDWSNRCNEFSNPAHPRFIWSDPYGWIGDFDWAVDADFATSARTEAVYFAEKLARAVGIVEKLQQLHCDRYCYTGNPSHHGQNCGVAREFLAELEKDSQP